jgi:hypothetical protein
LTDERKSLPSIIPFNPIANQYAEAKHGLGKHSTEVSPTDFEDMLRLILLFFEKI